jgi:probable DNA metabolism protein
MGGIYLYDGSPAGLLTVLARIVPEGIAPQVIATTPPPQQDLFTVVTRIPTDEEAAERFLAEVGQRLAPGSLHRLRQVLLADHRERELIICRFLLLAWQEGKSVGSMLTHPDVAPFWQLGQQVGREAHRYLGFVRFREVNGGRYYADISPEHRILPLVAPHFTARFRDQPWVIHDLNHGEGLVHDPGHPCLLLPLALHHQPESTAGEVMFRELWRSYFRTLAIAERRNLPLQRSKVPLKVRPWLTEFD